MGWMWGRAKSWTGGGVISKSNALVLRRGVIVWAPIVPDGGVVKDRRSVVINDPSRDPNEKIRVVGITSDGGKYDPLNIDRYPPETFYPIPWSADGSHPTTFTVSCAAKSTFVQEFSRTSLKAAGGILAGDELDGLLNWIAQLGGE